MTCINCEPKTDSSNSVPSNNPYPGLFRQTETETKHQSEEKILIQQSQTTPTTTITMNNALIN